MTPPLDIIINVADPEKKGLCAVKDGQVVAASGLKLPKFVRNDGQPINYRFVKPSQSGARQFDDIDVSGATVLVGVGLPDLVPTNGTWLITETTGDDDTGILGFDASDAVLQAALNLLPEVIAAGGVTVGKPASGIYQATFNNIGAQTARFSANTAKLAPLSVATISRVQVGIDPTVGNDGLQEIVLIQLIQNAYAVSNPANAFPSSGATVIQVQFGTSELPAIQRVTLNPFAYGGTFSLTIGGKQASAIPWDATGPDMQSFVGPKYEVSRWGNGDWQFQLVESGAIDPVTVDTAFLLVPIGVSGVLSLNRMEIWRAFINSLATSLRFIFEVQLQWPGEDAITVYRDYIFIDRNVLNKGTLLPATMLGLQTTYTALYGGVGFIYSNTITALSGGGTALDAVTTAEKALGFRYDFLLNGIPQSFFLAAGAADVDDPTGQVAPLDYNAGSNNRHWQRSA
jgi:hypothetical protein